jgi:hypothetical protein
MKIINKNGVLRFDTKILVGSRLVKVGSFAAGWYINPGSSSKTYGMDGPGNWATSSGYAYDGNTSTDDIFKFVDDYGWISWDFGGAMALGNARLWQDTSGDYVDRCWVFGSDTGVFGGEETQVAYRTGFIASASWRSMDFTTFGSGPASFRYWKFRGWRDHGSNWWRIGEIGWYVDPGLVLCNVPFGCKVDLIASGVSQENQTMNSFDKSHLQFVTTSGIDTITITENDGLTPWITMPFTYTSGDVWAFRWY